MLRASLPLVSPLPRLRAGRRAGLAVAHHQRDRSARRGQRQRHRRARRDGAGRQAARAVCRGGEPPGAGGTIGANMVAKAAPDGYTILVYGALASAHALHEKLPYIR